ncbi:MAG: aminotransferase class IV [Gordonia sp. (in: high G+C Gram-positive bacteria)]|uniref:aminotransferase class IV n=1 Tax=Gordonia sp. (in: high G+C Gram-positive bacteria) TaxID=84139 RepID=UPI003BB53FBE
MTLIVVSGDGRVLDPEQPLLHADDLAALRGDGVFETLLVRGGRACLAGPHLDRLRAGAAELDLPAPDLPALRRAIDVATAHWGNAEGMLRIVFSRGRESRPGQPTCYLTLHDVPDRVAAARRDGVTAITLPWSPPPLARIKSLAYAGHAAASREALARGGDDAVLVGADGVVFEGPRSSIVIAADGELLTPPRSLPILPGVTAAALGARERMLTVDDLRHADGVWLVSAVTLAAPIRILDGVLLGRSASMDVSSATKP